MKIFWNIFCHETIPIRPRVLGKYVHIYIFYNLILTKIED